MAEGRRATGSGWGRSLSTTCSQEIAQNCELGWDCCCWTAKGVAHFLGSRGRSRALEGRATASGARPPASSTGRELIRCLVGQAWGWPVGQDQIRQTGYMNYGPKALLFWDKWPSDSGWGDKILFIWCCEWGKRGEIWGILHFQLILLSSSSIGIAGCAKTCHVLIAGSRRTDSRNGLLRQQSWRQHTKLAGHNRFGAEHWTGELEPRKSKGRVPSAQRFSPSGKCHSLQI